MSYPLFAFTNEEVTVVTRGSTLDVAFDNVSHSPAFRRGTTVRALDFVPIDSALLYGTNHAPGWLHRAPEYERRLRMELAVRRVQSVGMPTFLQEILEEIKARHSTEVRQPVNG